MAMGKVMGVQVGVEVMGGRGGAEVTGEAIGGGGRGLMSGGPCDVRMTDDKVVTNEEGV